MPAFKRHPHHWPSLNKWLYSIGLTDSDIQGNFKYSAMVDYFPGYKNKSHRIPDEDEIKKEFERLSKTIKEFNPDLIVPIGRISIAHCLDKKSILLDKYIGNEYKAKAYNILDKDIIVIPLPHPSGASTWRYKEKNKVLLERALNRLKDSLSK